LGGGYPQHPFLAARKAITALSFTQALGSSVESQLIRRVLVCEVVAMSQDIPISVIALRASDYSPDGKTVTISLTTKYSAAERKYSIPFECLRDLIVDLQRLNAVAKAASIEAPIQPTVAPNRVNDSNKSKVTASTSLLHGECSYVWIKSSRAQVMKAS
jgi:hypothetical protein